jgi:hypothetical protein
MVGTSSGKDEKYIWKESECSSILGGKSLQRVPRPMGKIIAWAPDGNMSAN